MTHEQRKLSNQLFNELLKNHGVSILVGMVSVVLFQNILDFFELRIHMGSTRC